MTSIDYAELAGLNISLTNLDLTNPIHRDTEWDLVTAWMTARIKHLNSKKRP